MREKLLAVFLMAAPIGADEGLFSAGLRTQGNVDFEPGNDFISGICGGYSHLRLLDHRIEFQFTYLTSRIEAAFRNNLRQDWFLFSPVWHFRRSRTFDPQVQLDFGYQRYDTEFAWAAALENSTWVWGGKAGLGVNFDGGRYALRYALGYQQASGASSLVLPLPFSLEFSMVFL